MTAIQSTEHNKEEQLASELLATITEQDIEVTTEGKITLRDEVAKDRIISVNDPQMPHGHKTSRGKFNGHKGQIMIDEISEIITNIEVTPANKDERFLNRLALQILKFYIETEPR